jgi:hypothetical protein
VRSRDTCPIVVLVRGDKEVAAWPLVGTEHPDVVLIDRLARLQLSAQRQGYSIRLRRVPGPVLELLALAGLAKAVTGTGADLVVEVGGQPEGGEEPGVEEDTQ